MNERSKSRAPSLGARGRYRGALFFGVAVAIIAASAPTVEAFAQTFDNRPPIGRPRPGMRGGGGGGVGAAIGLGIGLGILGAAAARASQGEEPPRRVRVIEVDDDEPIPVRRGGDGPPPRKPPLRQAERTPPSNIRVPSRSEARYVPGEVLIEMRGDVAIDALARRLGLEVLSSLRLRLTGSTLHRLRARDGRTTSQILTRLQQERSVAAAQPNWVYTLQQDAGAPPVATAIPNEAAAASNASSATPPAPIDVVPGAPPTTAGEPPAAVPPPAPLRAAPAAAAVLAPAAPEAGGREVATAGSATAPAAIRPLPGQYAADKLNLPAAHGRSRGSGVLVAVIDTGVDEAHPELAGAVHARFDALDGVEAVAGAHGTAKAGAIAARV
ncbi:MAG: hypothetical protein OEL76_17685, partial [Siculibacillus sp.]|nr:hypothetical protein [Siculibacillus sp.]